MSGYIIRLFLVLGGFVALWLTVQYVQQPKPQPRSPSGFQKEISSRPHLNLMRHTEKVRGPLNSSLALVGSPAKQIGDAFVIEATVAASDEVADAKYRWKLPDGLALVNGSIEGMIQSINPGSPYKTQLTVRRQTAGNEQIHFAVDANKSGRSFASVSQFNSLLEDQLRAQKEVTKRNLPKSRSALMH